MLENVCVTEMHSMWRHNVQLCLLCEVVVNVNLRF
jgi:hypothetical protein